MKYITLWWQLKRAGAARGERADAIAVAKQLAMPKTHLSKAAKLAIAQQIGFKPVPVRTYRRLELAGAFAAFVLMVVAAQFTHPGSPLYALKRGTEHVRAIVQPSFKPQLEEERSQERETEKRSQDDATDASDDATSNSGSSTRKSSDSGERTGGTSGHSGSDDSKTEDTISEGSSAASTSGSNTSGGGSDDTSGHGSSSGSGRHGSEDE